MRIRPSFVHIIILLYSFVPLFFPFPESAGSEPPLPGHASARMQAEALNRSISIKPDLRPSLIDKEDRSARMKLRMVSSNEKKQESNNPQSPEPLPVSVSAKPDIAQPDPELKWQTLFPIFGAGAEKEAISFPMPSG